MSGQGGSKQKRAFAWEIARGGEGNERDKSDQVTTSHLPPSWTSFELGKLSYKTMVQKGDIVRMWGVG